jgi:hypothetical protein
VKRRAIIMLATAAVLAGCRTAPPAGDGLGGTPAPAGTAREAPSATGTLVAETAPVPRVHPASNKGPAAPKVNRLVGHWQLVKAGPERLPARVDAVYEFTAGGQFHLWESGRLVESGSYRSDGNAVSVMAVEAKRSRTDEYTIRAATDEMLLLTATSGGKPRDLEFARHAD